MARTRKKTSRYNAELLREDGSPKYLSIRNTPHGYALQVRGKDIDTTVRIGTGDYHHAYRRAVDVLMDVHDTESRTVRLELNRASTALLRRCKLRLKQRITHEVCAR